MGSNANEKNIQSPLRTQHQHNMPRSFLRRVDWSAILIDLWEAPGWLMSVPGQTGKLQTEHKIFASPLKTDMRQVSLAPLRYELTDHESAASNR
jgi:hypothetical protein